MPRGRPGRTPRVNQAGGKQAPRPIKGNHGNGGLVAPGPGRPKGSRNKFSGDLKRMILEALANAAQGGDSVDYLIAQARQDNPSPFMSLIGKCITQVTEGSLNATVDVKVTFED